MIQFAELTWRKCEVTVTSGTRILAHAGVPNQEESEQKAESCIWLENKNPP